jgi:two-component system NtrC family sensor kinase
MDTIPFLLAFLMFRIRRILHQNGTHPEWQKYIFYGYFALGFLFIVGKGVDDAFQRNPIDWIWVGVIFWVFYVIYKREEFQRLRSLVYAFLPLIIMETLREATQLADWDWLHKAGEYVEGMKGLAIAWLVVMLIIINRQNKALKKEEMARKEEERLRQITEEKKDQLELMVAERTAEITRQKEELQQAVVDLKAAQTQLVHSEKMASLGELTAGIAHEIQNPLNFVNNFSEINAELIAEMQEALKKGDVQDALHAADDIRKNQEKINHHGKRADAIVKSMLQHSRTGNTQKEATDVNALVDEYLRLSFHGLRAKDKSFNAQMDTQFDPAAGQVDMVAQDIGRVLLNLFNNAFYAVTERKKLGEEGYAPTVTVTTKRLDRKVRITVRDNGSGIPPALRDKIFQPFFTTKPTGQGTGLGLSLSFDIVTKGHGGKLQLESRENEFTQFDILLPA